MNYEQSELILHFNLLLMAQIMSYNVSTVTDAESAQCKDWTRRSEKVKPLGKNKSLQSPEMYLCKQCAHE